MTCRKCGSGAWVEDNEDLRLPHETWVKCIICGNRWEATGHYAAVMDAMIRDREAREARGRSVNVVRCQRCNRPCGVKKTFCWWHQPETQPVQRAG
jgi:hypothetical protein